MEKTDEEVEIELEIDKEGKIVKVDPIPNAVPPEPTPLHPNPISPIENNYSEINKRLLTSKLRLISNDKTYKLIFSLNEDNPIIKITFEIYGESGTEKIALKKVKCHCNRNMFGKVSIENEDNYVIIKDIQKDNLYTIDFEVNSEEKWAMEVKVYGINE